ncbi:MAG TPA: AsmA family protein [Casimicrobiaceae bacterium]
MHRTALGILAIAGAVVVVVLVGVAIAIATVDPARFVAPLSARVKEATGRDLTVQGPVSIAFSLSPKIVLERVSFANAPWAKAPAMFTAARVEAEIALLPLLSRRFEVVEFALVDPVIDLETDANGHGNWEFAPLKSATPGASPSSSPSSAIAIGNFTVRRGNLTYRSGDNGKVTNASIDTMSLRARDMTSPVAVEFRGVVGDVPVALSGDVGAADLWLRENAPYPIALEGEVAGKSARVETKLARSGTTTAFDDLNAVFDGVAATGSVRIVDEKGHRKYVVDLHVPTLELAKLSSATASSAKGAAQKPAGKAEPARGRYLIPDTPLPPIPLLAQDSEGALAIDDLVLRDGAHVRRVEAKFTSGGGAMDATFAAGELLGGALRGRLRVDGEQDAARVRLTLDAQNLDLPALVSRAGLKRDIHGGRVRASIDIDGHGASPHAIASTMSGSILAVSGPASLGRGGSANADALAQLLGALDPLSGVDAATELRCAVFRVPLSNGIAHIDRSIAVETAKLSASASGTLNFKDETLDLAVHPQLHQGIKIDVSQFASLVRIRGPFDKPSVGIDAANTAKTIAEMAALGASGAGIAALGRALIAPAAEHDDACAVAQGSRPAPREAGNASAQPSSPARGKTVAPELPKDLGKALGKLLGR